MTVFVTEQVRFGIGNHEATLSTEEISGALKGERPLHTSCRALYANAGINICSDIAVLITPMPTLRSLHIPRRQKVGLIFIFAFGACACVTSILRLYSLHIISTSTDIVWDIPDIAKWPSVEVNIGIVCACLPLLKPLIRRFAPRLLGNTLLGAPEETFKGGPLGANQGIALYRTSDRAKRFISEDRAQAHQSGICTVQRGDANTASFGKEDGQIKVVMSFEIQHIQHEQGRPNYSTFNMNHSLRSAPGSACQACRRQKMKCVREPDLPCIRCQKADRECIWHIPTRLPASQRRRRNPSSLGNSLETAEETYNQPPRGTPTPSTPDAPILPSIFSTVLYTHVGQGQDDTIRQYSQLQESSVTPSTDERRENGCISTEDTVQLIEMFRDRLLVTIPILIPADYEDTQNLITRYPNLASCISYVTVKYIPGYAEVRNHLMPVISAFLQTALNTEAASVEEELTTMQALIILYVFTRSNVIEKKSESTSLNEVSFWLIKATCETFAMHSKLHRAIDGIKHQLKLERPLQRTDTSIRKYLYWLWLYTTSHHVSIVTGTPPSINADASIRAAATVLESLKSNDDVRQTLQEAQLCLLWDKLSAKDQSLKEWWCSKDYEDISTSGSSRVTFEDVDCALNDWRAQFPPDVLSPRKGFMSLSPEYHYRYTRFCLNTHFIRHLTSTNVKEHDVQAIKRCVDSAASVLSLSHRLGPAGRDQLRYSPGFLSVTASFCSSFILQAIQVFPTLFPNPTSELGLVKEAASFMTCLGIDRSHGASACGRSVLQKLDATIEGMNRRQMNIEAAPDEHMATPIAPSESGVHESFNTTMFGNVDQYYPNAIFDFPGLLDDFLQGVDSSLGPPSYSTS
ncbi:hypothetical protein O988_05637 [Pseudogymnoascus sp. VKM F-3808]|nr:hypothetical protein O988_05637 [Pseudogymnoascus sp. VKM F-3808]